MSKAESLGHVAAIHWHWQSSYVRRPIRTKPGNRLTHLFRLTEAFHRLGADVSLLNIRAFLEAAD